MELILMQSLLYQLDKLLSMYVSIVRYQAGKVDAVKVRIYWCFLGWLPIMTGRVCVSRP